MIAIIDYGMGNLQSVQKAFEKVGATTQITKVPQVILNASHVVLPGVGAMAPAMQKLQELGLTDAIKKVIADGKPFLGICLGFQLMFDRSSEGGNTQGLKIFAGTVEKFTVGKVPHMGWNQLKFQPAAGTMFQGLKNNDDVYFCHSYYVKPIDASIVAATTDYGLEYTSAIAKGKTWGVQFHPEKSQSVGLTILKNFTKL